MNPRFACAAIPRRDYVEAWDMGWQPLAEPGLLVAIGGAEDKSRDPAILRFVAERVGRGPLVVMTSASADPDDAWREYRRVFRRLGVEKLVHVDARDREQALDDRLSRDIDRASGVFFTGGDQLRMITHIGDTPVCQRVNGLLARGGVVAGTSAGACVLSDRMLVKGDSRNALLLPDGDQTAPGLGLLPGVIIDMHFSQRGRMARLLAAVARNPGALGIGIDEDTAMAVQGRFVEVIGSGAIWFVHAAARRSSNGTDESGETRSIENVRLHVLGAGRRYDLVNRRPVPRVARPQRRRAALS
jgi:cyanophycinase